MTKKIAVYNKKGGQGKTTITTCYAELLGELGYKVLIVDTDVQRNSALFLDYQIDVNMMDLAEGLNIGSVGRAINEITENIHYIFLKDSDVLDNILAKSYVPHSLFEEVFDTLKEYDYILFDCPPENNRNTYTTLVYCDHIIVPVETTIAGYQAIIDVISLLTNKLKQPIEKIIQIIPNKVEIHTILARENLSDIEELSKSLNIEDSFKLYLPDREFIRNRNEGKIKGLVGILSDDEKFGSAFYLLLKDFLEKTGANIDE